MKATLKIKEWQQLSPETLKVSLNQLKEKLMSLRFLSASGKLKNVREMNELKKDVARIATILKQKKQ
ncbi:50S ribosomal protein L29 [Candidatus Parcubacteria bacterium]|nr:50S ribosomal protein L29 [Patescibacteria group bacterium]MBU4466768.1 50S ribosomal protein L29 [Patescibacteria group bacterium]MCG2688244.1 50S ribosomal protein L29 [Candidatus Parcubacteria bacterium]